MVLLVIMCGTVLAIMGSLHLMYWKSCLLLSKIPCRRSMQSLVAQRRLTVQPEETRALGARLGQWARAGDMVACCGALGAGKTTFVQGFSKGFGCCVGCYVG